MRPLRVLHTSDWHLDWVTLGVPRFPELARSASVTVSTAVSREVDLFAFTGDLSDPDSGTGVFRAAGCALACAARLHRAAIPSVWIAGNHDVIEDGSGDTTLTPLAEAHALEGKVDPGAVFVFQHPGHLELHQGVHLLLLPYTATSHGYDPTAVLREWLKQLDGTILILSHLMVPGMAPGEETTEMSRGREVVLPVDLLREESRRRPVVVLQGHYHRRHVERWDHGGGLYVVGSIGRLTFGEAEHVPGCHVVEVPR
jgi:DNA repair exonuclease SbcCD nuclease subunit